MPGTTFYFTWEVDLIRFLQAHLGPFGTQAASFMSAFGEEMITFAVLGFLYWCYDKRFGIFVGTNMMAGLILNPMLKNVVLRRRPYFDHPDIRCLKPVESGADLYDISAQGYSFPSGHSTGSASVYGSLPAYRKKRSFFVIGIVVPLFVGVSRFILGVHYPTDVIAGWLLGALCVIIFSYLQRHVTRRGIFYAVTFAFSCIGIFYCKTTDYYTGLGMMAGFFLAVPFEEKYVNFSMTRSIPKSILRVLGGAVLFLGMNTLLKLPFSKEFLGQPTYAAFMIRAVRYAVVTFLMIGVYPLAFDRFGSKA